MIEIPLYERSLRYINHFPNLQIKDITDEIHLYWMTTTSSERRYNLFHSEQWSIFLHAFKKFEAEKIKGYPNIDSAQLIEVFILWKRHLESIHFAQIVDMCPEDVEIFYFEAWLKEVAEKEVSDYGISKMNITYYKNGRMIIS